MSWVPTHSYAQLDTSGLWVNIDSITISATKISKRWINATRAVSEVNASKVHEVTHQTTLQDYVIEIPGLFSLNNNNKAQDLRIAVRGFGARSAFGVRGLKILVDGIPETTPDGQGQIDVVPLGLIRKVELIKGASSVLYGNASGGVLSISTLSEYNHNLLSKPLLSGRVTYGSYNTQQYQLTYGRKIGNTSFIVHGNQTSSDGYRGLSNYMNRNFKARVDHRFSKYSKINFMVDYLSRPTAQDPGSLTFEEMVKDRRQARQQNIKQQTGENLSNYKASFHYSLVSGERNNFDVYGFYSSRDFNGLLPFQAGGQINLKRTYFGQGVTYTVRSVKNGTRYNVKYGYELANQFDTRQRFENLEGTPGASTLDQKEVFKTLGLFIVSDINFGSFIVNGGIRFDHNSIILSDNFLFDADNSGRRSYTRFNPSLGCNLKLDDATALFANFSTGYDTPTLNELSNNPDTLGGFNKNLEPQSSVSYELGVKAQLQDQIKAQLAFFIIKSKEEIVPYFDSAYPDRTFFRNVSSSQRLGAEIESAVNITSDFALSASYALSAFKYNDHVVDTSSYTGNFLPGIPSHNATIVLQYKHRSGLSFNLQNQLVGSIFLNDANSAKSESYVLSNFHLGYKLKRESFAIHPFFGLKNILNAKYNDNLRINAFGGRYYEPAPGFNFYGGLTVYL